MVKKQCMQQIIRTLRKTRRTKKVLLLLIVVSIALLVLLVLFFSTKTTTTTAKKEKKKNFRNNFNDDDEKNNHNKYNNKNDLRAWAEIIAEESGATSDDPLDLQFLGLQSIATGCKFQFEIATWRETRLFFALHPECRHLEKCEAELPSKSLKKTLFESSSSSFQSSISDVNGGGSNLKTAAVENVADDADDDGANIIKHNVYAKRFDNDLRYAHMATIAKMKDERMILLYQAAPAAVSREEDSSTENDHDDSNVAGDVSDELGEYKLATEGLPEQHIEYTQSKDLDGKRWTPPVKLPIYNDGAVWSPVVHIDNDQIYVFYSESVGCKKAVPCKPPQCLKGEICEVDPNAEMCHHAPKSLWVPGGDIKYIKSIGDPAENKWTRAVTILSQDEGGGIPKVIANSLIVMKKTGHWVLPYWREQQNAIEDGTCSRKPEFKGSSGPDCRWNKRSKCMTGAQPFSGVLISENKGKSWQARGEITQSNTSLIEGSIAELNDGRIMQVFRTRVGCLYKSYSNDEGRSWTEPEPMPVPNPNSKVFLMRLEPNGELLLAFNNMKNQYRSRRGATKCRACRTHLHVAISKDGEGNEWDTIARIEDEIGYEAPRIHYPYMAQKDSTKVFVAYTRFYLGKRKGLNSLDQGVKVAQIDLTNSLMKREG
jgi:hypothetical protein